MANQNDSGLGSGLSDPSGIGGLTGSASTAGGSTNFDGARSTSAGRAPTDTGNFGTGGYGASSGSYDEGSQDTAARARELASNLRSRASEKVEETLSEQKYRAADSLGSIAQQIRSAGEQFPQDNAVGRYINQAAGQVDNIASFLNNRDVADLMDEIEQLARRQPAVFIGGAFALGVLGARFLKSSRRNARYEYQDRWSTTDSSAMLDMPRDSVNRPNAPGYSPASDRTSTGYGSTGSGIGTDSYGGTGSSEYGSTGLGNSGLGGATGTGSAGTSGSGLGDTGYGSTGSGTNSSGYGTSATGSSGLGGTGSGAL